MPDEDIMNRLKEIDDDEILGEEVSFDDLDFEGLDDMDSPAAAPVAQVVAPPAPLAEASSDEVKSEKPTVRKKSRTKSSKPKTGLCPPPDDAIPPARAETSVTEVEEVIVRAKVLRIVADRVIIEPGGNISFSP